MNHKKALIRVIVLFIVLAAVCLLLAFGNNLRINKGTIPSGKTPTESAEPTDSAPVENTPDESANEGTPDEDYIEPTPPPIIGETKRYSYLNLVIELTNVQSDRTETMLDDGGGEWPYTVITCYPGATLSVISADMSDPAYTEDGLAHPQWGILLDPKDRYARINLTDDLEPTEITPEMVGVFNFESSLFVFRFEPVQESA